MRTWVRSLDKANTGGDHGCPPKYSWRIPWAGRAGGFTVRVAKGVELLKKQHFFAAAVFHCWLDEWFPVFLLLWTVWKESEVSYLKHGLLGHLGSTQAVGLCNSHKNMLILLLGDSLTLSHVNSWHCLDVALRPLSGFSKNTGGPCPAGNGPQVGESRGCPWRRAWDPWQPALSGRPGWRRTTQGVGLCDWASAGAQLSHERIPRWPTKNLFPKRFDWWNRLQSYGTRWINSKVETVGSICAGFEGKVPESQL